MCVYRKDVCCQDIRSNSVNCCRKRRGPLCAVRDCEPLLEWLKAVELLVASWVSNGKITINPEYESMNQQGKADLWVQTDSPFFHGWFFGFPHCWGFRLWILLRNSWWLKSGKNTTWDVWNRKKSTWDFNYRSLNWSRNSTINSIAWRYFKIALSILDFDARWEFSNSGVGI